MEEGAAVAKSRTGNPNRISQPKPKLTRAKTAWMSPAPMNGNATRSQRIAKRSGTKEDRQREMEVDAVSTKANKAYHESRIAQNEGDNDRKK